MSEKESIYIPLNPNFNVLRDEYLRQQEEITTISNEDMIYGFLQAFMESINIKMLDATKVQGTPIIEVGEYKPGDVWIKLESDFLSYSYLVAMTAGVHWTSFKDFIDSLTKIAVQNIKQQYIYGLPEETYNKQSILGKYIIKYLWKRDNCEDEDKIEKYNIYLDSLRILLAIKIARTAEGGLFAKAKTMLSYLVEHKTVGEVAKYNDLLDELDDTDESLNIIKRFLKA